MDEDFVAAVAVTFVIVLVIVGIAWAISGTVSEEPVPTTQTSRY